MQDDAATGPRTQPGDRCGVVAASLLREVDGMPHAISITRHDGGRLHPTTPTGEPACGDGVTDPHRPWELGKDRLSRVLIVYVQVDPSLLDAMEGEVGGLRRIAKVGVMDVSPNGDAWKLDGGPGGFVFGIRAKNKH